MGRASLNALGRRGVFKIETRTVMYSHVRALEFGHFRFGGEIDLPFFVENFVGNFVGMKAVPEV